MKLNAFYKWSYIVLALLCALMLVTVFAVSIGGDNSVLKGPLIFGLFGVFFVAQLVCLVLYKPSLSIYKIGFYLLHAGLLIMLVGFLLFELAGISLHANVPVNSTGDVYPAITREDGSVQELGFGIRLNSFTAEYYESGAPEYYGAYLGLYDYKEDGSGAMYNSENIELEVNNTCRKNGWKIYLMSYDDGSAYLPEVQVFDTYSSVGGASAIVAQMTNSQKYTGSTVYYFIYDPQSAAYTSVGSDVSQLSSLSGSCKAMIYKGSDNTYYAYLSGTYVQLLFKKDPGEFVVLTGMIMIMLGVVCMCIIRGKDKLSVANEKNVGADKAKANMSAQKRGGGK